MADVSGSQAPQAGTSATKSETPSETKENIAELNVSNVDLLESGIEAAIGAMPDFLSAKWDPDDPTDTEVTNPPSPSCIRRIKKLVSFHYHR